MWWLVLTSACNAPAPERRPAQPPPHFAEWSAVVSSAGRGSVADAAHYARDLTAGAAAEWDGKGGAEGASAVGTGLGLVIVAEDRQESLDAVAATGRGCLICHTAAGAAAPPAPEWTHHGSGAYLGWCAAWGRVPAEGGDDATRQLAAAWSTGGLRASLDACAKCHGEGQ
jgi:hypothetical protein